MDVSRRGLKLVALSAAVAVLAVLLPSAASAVGEAWLSGYDYRKSLTIDKTVVSGATDLIDFPFLVSLTNTSLRTTANGGRVTDPQGDDIRFTSADGSTTLASEIETYDPIAGTLKTWVRIPTLSRTVNTTLYLYFGNAAVTISQQTQGGAWDSAYKGVWHMGETSGLTQADSTTFNQTATKDVSGNPTPYGAGAAAGAQSFDGSQAGERVSGSAAGVVGDKTIEAWINWTTFNDSGISPRIVSNVIDASNSYQLLTCGCGGNAVAFAIRDSANGLRYLTADGLSLNTWYHVVATYRASDGAIALTANNIASVGSSDSGWSDAGTGLTFGMRSNTDGFFAGRLDEVRISSAVRSTGWTTTERNNIANQGSYVAYGSDEASPLTGSASATATAVVDPTLSFTVGGQGTACNGQSATGFQGGSTGSSVALGRVTAATLNGAAQSLTLATNAANGYAVYVKASSPTPNFMRGPGSNYIADTSGTHGSPASSWTAGTSSFGYTVDDSVVAFGPNKWVAVTASPETVLQGASGSMSKTGCVGFQASVSGVVSAGNYSGILIYTAVPNY